MEITQQQFTAYVRVQMSGVVNMFDVRTVGQLTNLRKEEILEIMKRYTEFAERFMDEDATNRCDMCGNFLCAGDEIRFDEKHNPLCEECFEEMEVV